jgi:hypothetical protein
MTRNEIEKIAKKAYPSRSFRDIDGDYYDSNRYERIAFIEGYEQALKDNKLWEEEH